jgi:A/G-specific adenine glycosylase
MQYSILNQGCQVVITGWSKSSFAVPNRARVFHDRCRAVILMVKSPATNDAWSRANGRSMPPFTEHELDADWVSRVQRQLVNWYAHGHRDLPWRRERDPYRILVAEMMLVQTTVAAVVPYYERFLQRFPDVSALARGDEISVLKSWEGLGYYRRARQLHAAARAIVERHAGEFPQDEEAILALPGVGRYIAGAIISFAFNRPAPIVEANTRRVLARWLALEGDITSSATQDELWRAAEQVVPNDNAGTFNQAFMELGAVLCTVRDPACLLCPVASCCRARELGRQNQLPVARRKAPPLRVAEACALVVAHERILIVRRSKGGLWEGFWEFPTIHVGGPDPAGRSLGATVDLAAGVDRLTGIEVEMGPPVRTLRFGVTKYRVELTAHAALAVNGTATAGPGLDRAVWEVPDALANYPFASVGRRLATWVLEQGTDTIAQQVHRKQ